MKYRQLTLLIILIILSLATFLGCNSIREDSSSNSSINSSDKEEMSTGDGSSEPPLSIHFESLNEYYELIDSAEYDYQKFNEFLLDNTHYMMNGIDCPDDIKYVQNILENIPFPLFANSNLTGFKVNLESGTVFLYYEAQNNAKLHVTIQTNANAIEKMKNQIKSSNYVQQSFRNVNLQELYYAEPTGGWQKQTFIAKVDNYYVLIRGFKISKDSLESEIENLSFAKIQSVG